MVEYISDLHLAGLQISPRSAYSLSRNRLGQRTIGDTPRTDKSFKRKVITGERVFVMFFPALVFTLFPVWLMWNQNVLYASIPYII